MFSQLFVFKTESVSGLVDLFSLTRKWILTCKLLSYFCILQPFVWLSVLCLLTAWGLTVHSGTVSWLSPATDLTLKSQSPLTMCFISPIHTGQTTDKDHISMELKVWASIMVDAKIFLHASQLKPDSWETAAKYSGEIVLPDSVEL